MLCDQDTLTDMCHNGKRQLKVMWVIGDRYPTGINYF